MTKTFERYRIVWEVAGFTALHFLITLGSAGMAFVVSDRSAAVADLFLLLYGILSVPALIYRKLFGPALGLDLLGWVEMLIDSIIYAILTTMLIFLARRSSMAGSASILVLGISLVALGWWLRPS